MDLFADNIGNNFHVFIQANIHKAGVSILRDLIGAVLNSKDHSAAALNVGCHKRRASKPTARRSKSVFSPVLYLPHKILLCNQSRKTVGHMLRTPVVHPKRIRTAGFSKGSARLQRQQKQRR